VHFVGLSIVCSTYEELQNFVSSTSFHEQKLFNVAMESKDKTLIDNIFHALNSVPYCIFS
jgi:hypothetical protein